jgi:TetR/AcrR family transcriptional repressor of nem operon
MKVSRETAARHRAAIVEAAARLFRERGFDGVSVAEIMRAAGLTHGGFYGHFDSKDALAAEACGHAFANSVRRLAEGPAGDLSAYLDSYLSDDHRDRRQGGCPMAAYAGEVTRQDAAVQDEFAEGVGRYVEALAKRLPVSGGDAREQAITLAAALVGGLALARATAAGDPVLSQEILTALRHQLARLAGDADDGSKIHHKDTKTQRVR